MASNPNYSDVTPAIEALARRSLENSSIAADDYVRYDVKRGLRDLNGKGVVAGLTEVSEIVSNQVVGGKTVPCEGQLFYRGYSIEDLVRCSLQEKRFGFEEAAYLLLFGELPTQSQLQDFRAAPHPPGARRLHGPVGLLPHPTQKLCPGRDPQGAQRRYDELPGQMRPLHRLL